MNVSSAFHAGRAVRFAGLILTSMCTLLWAGPGSAASGCLKGLAPNKLCLDLNSVPGDSVQPSGLANTQTYVKYTAKLNDLVLGTSRHVTINFSFSPTPPSNVSVTSDPALTCTASGTSVSCLADKLDYNQSVNAYVVVEAPTYPTTATQMIASAVFGWNGNTTTVTQSLPVSDTSGTSYVPAGKSVRVATSGDSIVTADKPLWASVLLPAQDQDYEASINVVNDAPVDTNCVAGVYLSPTYGGPFLCRDVNDPTRGIQIYTSYLKQSDGFTPTGSGVLLTPDAPAVLTTKWDATLVQTAQLPPNPPAAPTGLPPFAQFVTSDDGSINGCPSSAGCLSAYAAVSKVCSGSGNAPCLEGVQQLTTTEESGDWQAETELVNNGMAYPGIISARSGAPLGALYAILDFLVGKADAQVTLPTKITSM